MSTDLDRAADDLRKIDADYRAGRLDPVAYSNRLRDAKNRYERAKKEAAC
jgi:hypothetical protein